MSVDEEGREDKVEDKCKPLTLVAGIFLLYLACRMGIIATEMKSVWLGVVTVIVTLVGAAKTMEG